MGRLTVSVIIIVFECSDCINAEVCSIIVIAYLCSASMAGITYICTLFLASVRNVLTKLLQVEHVD